MTIFLGCDKNFDDVEINNIKITSNEHSLNLKSPNGKMIYDNIHMLKKEMAESIVIGEEFEITSLDYRSVSKGYFVIINYVTIGGRIGNFAISEGTPVNILSDKVIMNLPSSPRLKNPTETGNVTKVKFRCLPSGNCSNCMIETTEDPNTNLSTTTCSCSTCELETTVTYN
jgi:hypothetical protein